jgi:hypothetical protein
MSKPETDRPGDTVSRRRRFQVEETVLILLLIFSLAGVGITNFSAVDGYWYWMVMIFIFGLSAMMLGYVKAKQRDHLVRELWAVQSLHWLGVMAVVGAVFSLLHAGMLEEDSTGLVILLILALATYLDGIRLGWRFSMVGVFLAITAVVAAHVDEYMWVIIPLAIVIVAFSIYWEKRRAQRRTGNV